MVNSRYLPAALLLSSGAQTVDCLSLYRINGLFITSLLSEIILLETCFQHGAASSERRLRREKITGDYGILAEQTCGTSNFVRTLDQSIHLRRDCEAHVYPDVILFCKKDRQTRKSRRYHRRCWRKIGSTWKKRSFPTCTYTLENVARTSSTTGNRIWIWLLLGTLGCWTNLKNSLRR